jgi:hypothetical protein
MFRSNLAQNGRTLPSGYRSREGKRFSGDEWREFVCSRLVSTVQTDLIVTVRK